MKHPSGFVTDSRRMRPDDGGILPGSASGSRSPGSDASVPPRSAAGSTPGGPVPANHSADSAGGIQRDSVPSAGSADSASGIPPGSTPGGPSEPASDSRLPRSARGGRRAANGPPGRGRMLAYSAGNLPVNLLSQAFATYVVFYYVDVLGVRPALISLAMVIHGIVNAILNPLVGYLSDRTESRRGRRIPYMLYGAAPLAAVFTLVWFPLASGPALFWYFLGIVLLYDILFVVVVLNYSALFPEMFPTIHERTAVSSWRQMFGILGMICGVAVPPLLYNQLGWGPMGLLFALIAFLFFLVMLRGSVEKERQDTASFGFLRAVRYTFANRSFVTYVLGSLFVQFTFALLTAGIPFFTKYVLDEPDSTNTVLLGSIFVTAIPMVYVWGRWTRRLGPRGAVLLATACYAAALSLFGIIGSVPLAIGGAALVGFSLAGLLVLLDVLLSEVIDEDERVTQVRREGMYFGMNGFVVRWGVSLQAVVMGAVLETSGYEAHLAVQPETVDGGIRLMLSGVPAAALLLAFLCFWLYPIRKSSNHGRSQSVLGPAGRDAGQ